jgi:hypothetical protein
MASSSVSSPDSTHTCANRSSSDVLVVLKGSALLTLSHNVLQLPAGMPARKKACWLTCLLAHPFTNACDVDMRNLNLMPMQHNMGLNPPVS